jgi:hypothetical protein
VNSPTQSNTLTEAMARRVLTWVQVVQDGNAKPRRSIPCADIEALALRALEEAARISTPSADVVERLTIEWCAKLPCFTAHDSDQFVVRRADVAAIIEAAIAALPTPRDTLVDHEEVERICACLLTRVPVPERPFKSDATKPLNPSGPGAVILIRKLVAALKGNQPTKDRETDREALLLDWPVEAQTEVIRLREEIARLAEGMR